MSNSLDPDQDHFVKLDLGPNCLQSLPFNEKYHSFKKKILVLPQ